MRETTQQQYGVKEKNEFEENVIEKISFVLQKARLEKVRERVWVRVKINIRYCSRLFRGRGMINYQYDRKENEANTSY